MKPKPIKQIQREKNSNLWAYEYLNAVRLQLGDDEFARLIRMVAIDENAKALMRGKKSREAVEIGKRAYELLKSV